MIRICLALGVLIMAGCVNPISERLPEAAAKQAVYPPAPTRAQMLNYFRYALKDYDSAKFDGWILYRAYVRSKPPVFCHIVTVDVNAKNSFGGYAGFQHYTLIVHANGSIRDGTYAGDMVELVDIVDMPAE